MTVLKMDDLNRQMTTVVSQYMAQGLILHCEAMSGHQGELGKVALANDTHVYMIYLERTTVGERFADRLDAVRLVVELHVRNDRMTYWLGAGEVVYEELFYEMPCNRRFEKIYTDSEEDCREMYRKHWNRCDIDRNWKVCEYNTATIINIIKSKTGRKRVFAENIVSVERRTDSNMWNICYVFSGKKHSFYVGTNV